MLRSFRLTALTISVGLTAMSCSEVSTPGAIGDKPTASGIDLATFDTQVRPQDDLFHHVNGGWLAKTEIPADKSSYGSFDLLVDKSQADLRAIVEDAARSGGKTAGSDAQKIGDFYESFMNEARAEEIGLTPLQSELAAIDRIRSKADLARYFGRMFKLNLVNPLVGFVDGDAQQPDREILYVFQGGLGLPDRDYYLKEDAKLRSTATSTSPS
jgi:predicted metalloendopeptidase